MIKIHTFTHTFVGPNVIIQCSCQAFHIVKRKEYASEAFQAAKVHAYTLNRKQERWANVVPDAALIAQLKRKNKEFARKNKRSVEQFEYIPQHGVKRGSIRRGRG